MLTICSVSTPSFNPSLETQLSSLASCLTSVEDLDFVLPVADIFGEVYGFTSLDLTCRGLKNLIPVAGCGAFDPSLFILLP